MKINPLTAIDFYKADHRRQYPEGTTEVYSNFTPRSAKLAKTWKGENEKIVFFGLQFFIKDFLIDCWNEEFFNKPKDEVVSAYKRRMDNSLGKNAIDVSHIEALHNLGYLPIKIKALEEGSKVNIGVPVLTIVNTLPEFFWLTNYIESVISSYLWKPITSATTAYEYKKILTHYADISGGSLDFIPFQAHDFSFRGMCGVQDAAISGAAHLTSFVGTDSVLSIDLLEKYYGADSDKELVGCSVPATEHSVMCMGSKDGEFETFKKLITETYPSGIVSIVSDTWDLWKVVTEYMPRLKDEIMARDGKVVIRPDCYDSETKVLTPSGWEYFSELTGDSLVAQVLADGTYEFVKPLKVVDEYYSGDMIKFKDHHGKVDLLVTPNHRMVTKLNDSWRTTDAEDITVTNFYNKFVRSAKARSKDGGQSLGFLERLNIAFQADGSFTTSGKKIRFSFSKPRKILRLRSLLDAEDIEYKVYTLSDGRVEFKIDLSSRYFSKDFNWIDLATLDGNWCKEFIEELSHWDAHIRNEGRIKFDTTNSEVHRVVELIALSAGYGCYQSTYVDDRKEIFSDIYTSHIMLNNTRSTNKVVKEIVSYSGTIHCVTIPTGRLVVKRNQCTLVCGNSGDPADIICGTIRKTNLNYSPQEKGVVECLYDIFGGITNAKGYQTLDSHIGVIYGDSITLERAEDILQRLYKKDFASDNIVFGVGSYTYQYVTRDTYGFAMKATSGVVDGERREIFKAPITDSGTKKSAKGLLRVEKEDGKFVLYDRQTEEQEKQGLLTTVFNNGKLISVKSLNEIREIINS